MKKIYAFLLLLFLSQSIQLLSCYFCRPSTDDPAKILHYACDRFQANPTPETLTTIKNCLNRYKAPDSISQLYLDTLFLNICSDMRSPDPKSTCEQDNCLWYKDYKYRIYKKLTHEQNQYYVDLISVLITEHHANIHAKHFQGHTPLHFARSFDTIKRLLYFGANPNARNDMNNTPLHYFLYHSDNEVYWFQVIRLLFETRTCEIPEMSKIGKINRENFNTDVASVHMPDHRGYTPLHLVKSPIQMNFLIQQATNINPLNESGDTPLISLFKRIKNFNTDSRFYALLAILLGAGADPNIKNNEKKRAIDYMQPHDRSQIQDPIQEYYNNERACAALIAEGRTNTGLCTVIMQRLIPK